MWPRVRRARAAPPGSARRVRPWGQADSFFGRVYTLVRRIPPGQRATYGQIARLLRSRRSARIVGWAMHGTPKGSGAPWHRVVQQGGSLSPAVSPAAPGRQRRLLEREGVTFRLDGRIDMAQHQSSPPVAGRGSSPPFRPHSPLDVRGGPWYVSRAILSYNIRRHFLGC